ncbi:Lysophospholipid acyltransferase 7 [Nymphon striatum]|nr:Lysophospholipid acyltransferase 7 [Nymphon striatum]
MFECFEYNNFEFFSDYSLLYLQKMTSFKDIIYMSVLVSTICVGHFVRKIQDRNLRKWAYSIIGFIVVLLVSGRHIVYSIALVFFNYLIILFVDRRICHWASFYFCFLFLIFSRTCSYFHLYSPPDTNAVQMILTLKMIGLAFELVAKSHPSQNIVSNSHQKICKPSLLDMYHYSFCYAGILVGPYFTYQTYRDMIRCPYDHIIPFGKFLKECLKVIPLYIALYLISSLVFPQAFIGSEEIRKNSIIYKLTYMMGVFFTFRMKMYLGFVLGECVCIMAGIGCYPSFGNPVSGAGLKNTKSIRSWMEKDCCEYESTDFNFEAIRNVNVYQCEFARNLRFSIRNWNMTIQYWLAVYVYKQFPIKVLKIPVTMLTSAVWHGVNPGYYISLLNVPLVIMAQDQMEKAIRDKLSESARLVYDWISWFMTMFLFSYLIVGFLILDATSTYLFWKSIYFIGHVMMLSFILIGYVISVSYKNSMKLD